MTKKKNHILVTFGKKVRLRRHELELTQEEKEKRVEAFWMLGIQYELIKIMMVFYLKLFGKKLKLIDQKL